MENFVKPFVLEQWNTLKGQYEEIKDMSVKFWKDDKLYFKIETMEDPTNYWSSGVAKAMAYSRCIIWWAEGFKPHVCFRGTFNSEEELSEFLVKFKEFITSSGDGDKSSEGWELPSSASSTQQSSNNPTQQVDDLISFQEENTVTAPCLSPGIVSNNQRGEGDHQEKPKSIFTIPSRPRKRSLEQKRTNLNKIKQKKRNKTDRMPFTLYKRITKPSKSDNLLPAIKSVFQFLLSDEEVNILILSKSSEPIRITGSNRATRDSLKWSLEDRPKISAITEEERLKDDNYTKCTEEKTSFHEKYAETIGRTTCSAEENADEVSLNATQETVPSRKWDFSVVMTFVFFLLVLVTWYLQY